jgi:hypothetical protein
MWTQEQLKDVEILGINLECIKSGFGAFSLLASRILIEERMGTEAPDGQVRFEPGRWYPVSHYLRALDRMGAQFGAVTLQQTGFSIPEKAPFPPTVTDIDSGLRAVNGAYYMNHGTGGQPLLVPGTGQVRKHIGRYSAERTPGQKRFECRSDSPYPCAFDGGIFLSMARRFEPTARLAHGPGGCRAAGADACTFVITW